MAVLVCGCMFLKCIICVLCTYVCVCVCVYVDIDGCTYVWMFVYIYVYMKCVERENVLFNDALNTFYLRLYGFIHMVKDHSDSTKGNPLPPHRLLLSINSKGSFICTDRITHTTTFVTPVVEHWLEREIAQWAKCVEC